MVFEKCCIRQASIRDLTKAKYKDKELSIFRTGKELVIREFKRKKRG